MQIKVLPISQECADYAVEVFECLQNNNFRCEIDLRNEKINYKIFQAQTSKVPYMLIIGKKEQAEKFVSVRKFGEQKTNSMSLTEFIDLLNKEL